MARFVQISESNVEPADCSTPTTTHVRPPSGKVSPTSSRSRAESSDGTAGPVGGQHARHPFTHDGLDQRGAGGCAFCPSFGSARPFASGVASRTPAEEIQAPPG